MIECNEVDCFGRVFLIEDFHLREDFFRHILHSRGIAPDAFKELEKALCHAVSIHTGIGVIAYRRGQSKSVAGEIHRSMDGDILLRIFVCHIGKAQLGRVCLSVGSDAYLPSQPVGALLGNGGLGQLVSKFQLEFVAGEMIAHITRSNIKLALEVIFLLDVGWRGEDEAHLLNGGKLLLERFIGVDCEIRRDHGELRTRLQCLPKLVDDTSLLLVVQYFRWLQNSPPTHAGVVRQQKYHRFSAI